MNAPRRLDGATVGDPVFVDGDGLTRFAGRTCNLYGHAGDAEQGARNTLRPGALAYVWRTSDGLYDFSATDDADRRLPELENATLVRVVVIPAVSR